MEEGNEGKTNLWVKLGAAEIRYEGSETFLKDEVMPNIVERILEMVHERAELQKPPPVMQIEGQKAPLQSPAPAGNDSLQQRQDLSTTTIATLIGTEKAGDLAIAAAAHLISVKGAQSATREEILAEMRGATAFFKASMVNNLSNTLKKLVRDDRLRLVASDTYSLSHKERQAIEAKLAELE